MEYDPNSTPDLDDFDFDDEVNIPDEAMLEHEYLQYPGRIKFSEMPRNIQQFVIQALEGNALGMARFGNINFGFEILVFVKPGKKFYAFYNQKRVVKYKEGLKNYRKTGG